MKYIWMSLAFTLLITQPILAFTNISTDINVGELKVVPVTTATPTQIPTLTILPTANLTETPSITPPSPFISIEPTESTKIPPITPSSQTEPTSTISSSSAETLNQKNIITPGIIAFLVFIIIMQSWSKIKKWLHERTQE